MDLQSFTDTIYGANTGNDLAVRIAVKSTSGIKYRSSTAFILNTDGQWHHANFLLNDLVLISGTESLSDVLADVSVLRILSAVNGPAWKGDNIQSLLGVDNISAVPLPATAWLFISAFITLPGFKKRKFLKKA